MATELATPQELALQAQQKLRSTLDPSGLGIVNLAPGSRNDVMISTDVALTTRVFQYTADRLSARSLATATGDDLDALVLDIYQDTRKSANAATGSLYLQRTGTGATVIPAGSRFTVPGTSTQQGATFTPTQDVQVASNTGGAGSPIAVPVTCTVNDVVGNVYIPLISIIQDPLPDTSWAIASLPANVAQYMAGGTPSETDDQLRSRIQKSAFDDSKRRGTLAAILAGTLQVPGIFSATVVEPGDGTILVYCGDQSYNLSSALQTAVLTNLENFRAFGVPALPRSYSVITVTIIATLYMQRALSNYNTPTILTQATQNLNTYFNNRRRPDEFFGELMTGAIATAHPETQHVVLNAVSTSSGPAPDGTGSIRRVADAFYGSVTSMPRYVIASTSVQINIAPPATQ